MPPTPAPSVWLPSLTGLRFVAAAVVFVVHAVYGKAREEGGWPPAGLFLTGTAAVSLFFVLSGFVLTLSARGPGTARSFWRRRFARLFPSHLVVLAALMLLMRGAGVAWPGDGLPNTPPPSLLGDLSNALLLNTLVPLPQFLFAGNPVTWSLACELLFYLLFPWLFPLVSRIPSQWLPAVAVGAVAAVWAVPTGSLWLGGPPLPQDFVDGSLTGLQMWCVYSFPLCQLPQFILGMILARMHADGVAVRFGVVPSAALLGVCLVTGLAVLPRPFLFAAATIIPVALLVRAVASLDACGAKSWLRTQPLVFLGDLTYGFYLLHAAGLAVVMHYWGGWSVVGTVAAFLLTVSASWLLHVLVERPCYRRLAVARDRPGRREAQLAECPATERVAT
ncbi:acyltransferase family protein [Streptomyces agglomeratus]|uniref:acyltransferase family protein n=1 Tax=Streptomyces agglomeratus TaxID=285458 RepID=UPI0009A098E3|nr:acyltransferase [Streptomyces agglomeratus]